MSQQASELCEFDTRVSLFLSHRQTIEVDSIRPFDNVMIDSINLNRILWKFSLKKKSIHQDSSLSKFLKTYRHRKIVDKGTRTFRLQNKELGRVTYRLGR